MRSAPVDFTSTAAADTEGAERVQDHGDDGARGQPTPAAATRVRGRGSAACPLYGSDGPVDATLVRSVGMRVHVDGYCDGVLRFYGPHKVQSSHVPRRAEHGGRASTATAAASSSTGRSARTTARSRASTISTAKWTTGCWCAAHMGALALTSSRLIL